MPDLLNFIDTLNTNQNFIIGALALITFLIIYEILRKTKFVGEQKGVYIIISIAITLIAVFYSLKNNLLDANIIPYRSLGTAIIFGLPTLLIYFVTFHSNANGIIRKIVWTAWSAFTAYYTYTSRETLSQNTSIVLYAIISMSILIILLDKPLKNKVIKNKRKNLNKNL